MDIQMRDGSARRAGRQQQQRNVSGGARASPYARDRPQASRMRSDEAWANDMYSGPERVRSTSGTYPPTELNIKGASGPTMVVVSNLALGTTAEDVKLTFETFGPLREVKERPPPTLNYPSVSFELAFENKEDGLEAIRKFDGALADGRLLKLGLLERRGERGPHTAFSQATAAATAARKGPNGELVPGPAPLARAPSSSKLRSDLIVQQVVPSGPSQGNAGRELLGNNGRATAIRQHQSRQQQQQKAAPSLASRLLGPSVAKKAGVAASGLGTGVGVKGAPKGPKSTTTPSLQSRISIPLAQRLAGGPSAAPKSDLAKIEADKKNKAKGRKRGGAKRGGGKGGAANKEAGGMDVD